MRSSRRGERASESTEAAASQPSFWAAFATQLLARPRRLLGAFVATPVGLAAAFASPPGVAGASGDGGPVPMAVTSPAVPAVTAPVPVEGPPQPPSPLAGLANAAAGTCPGLPPSVLTAIAKVESNHGRDKRVSKAGARGPMQYLPSTWRAYGIDGDGDGRADINNVVDAMYTAARHLCANGGGDPEGLRKAVWNYNHSHVYVRRVIRLAGLAER